MKFMSELCDSTMIGEIIAVKKLALFKIFTPSTMQISVKRVNFWFTQHTSNYRFKRGARISPKRSTDWQNVPFCQLPNYDVPSRKLSVLQWVGSN